jgi:hypothetical protein
MDYGNLVRRSWLLTWRHRFLWVLGLFAGGAGVQCSGSGGDIPTQIGPGSEEVEQLGLQLSRALGEIGRWLSQNLGLVLLLIGLVVLIGLALLVLSFIARGAIARATSDLALGRPMSLGGAWRAGRQLFWRFLNLWLILFGLGLAAVALIGTLVGLAWLADQASGGSIRAIFVAAGVLLGLLLVAAFIPILIGLSIVVSFAERAMAVENVGPLAGLGTGLRLVRANLGTSLLAWLLSLALNIGSGIAVLLGLLVLAVPLGAIGVLMYLTAGASLGLLSYAVVAALLLAIALWLLGAVVNVYFWSYWTMVYLRFTSRLSSELEPLLTAEEPGRLMA